MKAKTKNMIMKVKHPDTCLTKDRNLEALYREILNDIEYYEDSKLVKAKYLAIIFSILAGISTYITEMYIIGIIFLTISFIIIISRFTDFIKLKHSISKYEFIFEERNKGTLNNG